MPTLLFDATGTTITATAEGLDGVADALRTDVVSAAARGRAVVVARVEAVVLGERRAYRARVVPVAHPYAGALVELEGLEGAPPAGDQAAVRALATSIAHEVGNPLASISGAVQVIASSLAAGDARRAALIKVHGQVLKLGSLVGDMLALSLPVAPSPRAIELLPVAQAAAHGKATVEGTGRAHADPALLRRVLASLVRNAWQAGARRVVLTLADGRACVVDDGPGGEPGLGVAIAHRLVESMAGAIALCASPLGGAGFEVSVPVEARRLQ